jgi:PhnB protein
MSNAIPPNREGLIPHLVCSPCTEALKFYEQAFGAKATPCLFAPDGKRVMHAEMLIDGKVVFLADDFPEYCSGASQTAIALGGTPVTIHRYVEDCDAALQRAVDAGATVKMPATDMFWGDRYAVVTDPFGHCWSFATHVRDVPPEQLQSAMCEAFEQADAATGT